MIRLVFALVLAIVKRDYKYWKPMNESDHQVQRNRQHQASMTTKWSTKLRPFWVKDTEANLKGWRIQSDDGGVAVKQNSATVVECSEQCKPKVRATTNESTKPMMWWRLGCASYTKIKNKSTRKLNWLKEIWILCLLVR